MAVCKHCGTEIEEGLSYCPNCGQSLEENSGRFFDADEGLEAEAYNIFDTPEEFDMDSLLDQEFTQVENEDTYFASENSEAALQESESVFFEESAAELAENAGITETTEKTGAVEERETVSTAEKTDTDLLNSIEEIESSGDLTDLLGLFGSEMEEPPSPAEDDIFALDDLLEGINEHPEEIAKEENVLPDAGLEELLAVSKTEEEPEKKKKKEKRSFFKMLFGNVPIDPSKVKPEPTPEEIAAKKQKEEEEKKAKAEEKKLAAEEKKQLAQREKEEKARQKALAKEEKKMKKMQEAQQVLEEIKETRINRLGATIVMIFFAVCAVAIFYGSKTAGYAISINNAEQNFNKAYNNNVRYYTDAYNDIYGLEIREEDQVLNDKIMTVMFVNTELNSYNSKMVLKDYESALHSLLVGLYRYGCYYESAIPLGVDRDLDYVRTQILKELQKTFGVSEDQAELLRSKLEAAGGNKSTVYAVDADAAREYNLELYKIVEESGLHNDSGN